MNKDFIPPVKAAEDGSESALEELYNMTKEMSYFMALSITYNEQDALAICRKAILRHFQISKLLNHLKCLTTGCSVLYQTPVKVI